MSGVRNEAPLDARLLHMAAEPRRCYADAQCLTLEHCTVASGPTRCVKRNGWLAERDVRGTTTTTTVAQQPRQQARVIREKILEVHATGAPVSIDEVTR